MAIRILCISGSARADSTNTWLLHAIASHCSDLAEFAFARIDDLPIFSSDLEGDRTPPVVERFATSVGDADGLLFAVPEYAHGIPGGLKNGLDWLVSRAEFPDKPMMMVHASARGAFVRAALAEILHTMSGRLVSEDGLTLDLMGKSPAELKTIFAAAETQTEMRRALQAFLSQLNRRRQS